MDEEREILGEVQCINKIHFFQQGSHSIVRECKCKETGKDYAVKIFRSEDEEMFIHAEREFKILKKLEGHPNIIQGIEYIPEVSKSRGYIVMQKVIGSHILDIV